MSKQYYATFSAHSFEEVSGSDQHSCKKAAIKKAKALGEDTNIHIYDSSGEYITGYEYRVDGIDGSGSTVRELVE